MKIDITIRNTNGLVTVIIGLAFRLALGLGTTISAVLFSGTPALASVVAPLKSVDGIDPEDQTIEKKTPPPLWQFGFAAGAGVVPHYPASDQTSIRVLGAPAFRYHGRILRADDEGTRARLLRFENSEVDVSGAASFPVSSSENEARKGMRQLDWVGEAGPRLVFKWRFQNAGKLHGDLLRLTLPFRTVASSDGSYLAHRGFNFQPGLSWERILNAPNAKKSQIAIELEASTSFIDTTLANYFFGVSKLDETPTRRPYEAAPGLLALSTGLSLVISPKAIEQNGSAFFIGVRNVTTAWSANRSSPLHRADQQLMFFAGFNILWFNSETQAEHAP